jgi:hypothetical protein
MPGARSLGVWVWVSVGLGWVGVLGGVQLIKQLL